MLEAETQAEKDVIPLWGQRGSFIVCVNGMRLRIELESMFGIGVSFWFWPGFSANNKPFISETGYQSFLGVSADAAAGLTPAAFVSAVIERRMQETASIRRKRKH